MTNEDKARRLCCSGCNNYVCYTNKKQCPTLKDLLTMADWKDEQFQKVLDYAENCYGVFSFEQRENFINHIKEIFYGKE